MGCLWGWFVVGGGGGDANGIWAAQGGLNICGGGFLGGGGGEDANGICAAQRELNDCAGWLLFAGGVRMLQ